MKNIVVLVIGSFILIGILLFRFYTVSSDVGFADNEQFSYEGRLYEEPQRRNAQQRFRMYVPGKGEISIITELYPDYHYGDYLSITGRVKRRVIGMDEVVLSSYFPKVIRAEEQGMLFSHVAQLRASLMSLFSSALPDPGGSLLIGIVFGIKMTMSDTFFAALRETGVLHVIAASGMNVIFVSSFLFTFHRIFFGRRVALLFTIFGLFLYTILSGLEPSIIRASIMSVALICASLVGRQYTGGIILLFTGYCMILYNPRYLTDLGFQLSFLATSGILFLKPVLTGAIPKHLARQAFFTEDFMSTLSAQLTTFPLLFYTFGSYNLLSLLVNVFVLWTIPYLMIIGGVGALVGLLVKPVGIVVLWLSLPLLEYFVAVVMFFAKFPLRIVDNSSSAFFVIGYFFLLISIFLFLKKRYEKKITS